VTLVKWKLVPVPLEIILISRQDRLPVCAKCTIGSDIELGALDGTPRWVDQVEDRFRQFGDSVNLDAR
jgi:hypothetical protein